MADAYSVANSILVRSFRENVDMTPMKLQKIVYFLYADYLSKTGRALFDERFETWKYGPVLRSLYDEFKAYGSNAIKRFAKSKDGSFYVVAEDTSPQFKESLNRIWDKYKTYDGIYLSSLTHKNGTAWWKAVSENEQYLSDVDIREDATLMDDGLTKDSAYLYGIAEKEVDEPIPGLEKENGKDTLELTKIKQKEKSAVRKEKRYYTAFKLIVGCLIMLGMVYIIDTIVNIVINKSISTLTESLLEIIKTLLFTLSGYLFAREENRE